MNKIVDSLATNTVVRRGLVVALGGFCLLILLLAGISRWLMSMLRCKRS